MSTKLKSVRAPGEAKRQELLQKSEQILSQVSIPELPLLTLYASFVVMLKLGLPCLAQPAANSRRLKNLTASQESVVIILHFSRSQWKSIWFDNSIQFCSARESLRDVLPQS